MVLISQLRKIALFEVFCVSWRAEKAILEEDKLLFVASVLYQSLPYRMGNRATVEYCDCRHFSLIKKKCEQCLKTVCPSCSGFPLINEGKYAVNPEKISLTKVCRLCFTTLARVGQDKEYEVMGSENRSCLLMIHSEGLSRGMFKKYALGLREKGFKCILIDLPAHGALIQEQFTFQNYVRCIKRAVEREIGDNPFYVLACSLPALAFLQFISENQVRCKRAILLSTGNCLTSHTNNFAGNQMEQLICPKGESFARLVGSSDLTKAGVLQSTLQGGFYPLSRRSLLQFQKRLCLPACLSQLRGNLKVLFINGEFQERKKEMTYHEALLPSSSLFTYLNVGAFFWCYRAEYYKLLNDLSRFFEQS